MALQKQQTPHAASEGGPDGWADPDDLSIWNHPDLSPRELEIARLVSKGHPNKTIAGILEISPWTVATHLRRVFTKLRVGSRAAMVTRIMEERSH